MTADKRNLKTIINEFVVKMRKYVKIARIWTIKDLKKKSDNLLKKKGNEQEIEKNTRKAERYLNRIKTLKSVHLDQVSKYALCKLFVVQPDNDEVRQSIKILAEHKLIKQQLTNFEGQHHIPVDKRIILLRSLGVRYLKKKSKSIDSLQEEHDVHLRTVEVDNNTTVVQPSQVPQLSKGKLLPEENFKKGSNSLSNNGFAERSKDIVKSCPKLLEKKDKSNMIPTGVKYIDHSTITSPISSWKVTEKLSEEMEIKQLNICSMAPVESTFLNMNEIKKASYSPVSNEICDPFFLRNDKNSEITPSKNLPQAPLPNTSMFEKDIPCVEILKESLTHRKSKSNKTSQIPNRESFLVDKKARQGVTDDETNLHPSWQAKRKEKLMINRFDTSKRNHIKFDD